MKFGLDTARRVFEASAGGVKAGSYGNEGSHCTP
jgi:hypothetical protein